MWTEEIQESNGDLAISFQDMKECDDIWLKLCEVITYLVYLL